MPNPMYNKIVQIRNRIILLPLSSWFLDATLLPAANYVLRLRTHVDGKSEHDFVASLAKNLFKEMKVLNGPFKNMVYPSLASAGSTLYPKLLGSYELEISSLIESLCNDRYTQIIDIGCAEGYYAVGLGMRNRHATVFAYDISHSARAQCNAMARKNNVHNRVHTFSKCSAETLLDFVYRGRTLILSDCEGYELNLFTKQVVEALINSDVLIESHDFINIETSSILESRFRSSHDMHVFKSVDDIDKAYEYCFEEIESLPLSVKKALLCENRPSVMKWLFFASRKPHL